jgi:predicted ATPase
MDGGSAALEALLVERLGAADLPDRISGIVLAALLGEGELANAVGEAAPLHRSQPVPVAGQVGDGEPPGAYLTAVRVAGFRGIGPPAELRLQPGPGLTVVTGRNGSGKSSFAEAIELALTRDNKRWSGRTTVWRDGWRNLHAAGTASIVVELAVDGQPGRTRVSREWAPGVGLADAVASAQRHGQPRQRVDALGWSRALEVYRPFLSYAELGALVEGRPSDMYDAVQSILGLDQLVAAEKRLAAVRKQLDDQAKEARATLPALRSRLAGHPDSRVRAATAALAGATAAEWDLGVVEELAVAGESLQDSDLACLRELNRLALPERDVLDSALSELHHAVERVDALVGTPAASARRLAALLSTVLEGHAEQPGQPCPVCAGRTLDEEWATATRAEVARLTAVAAHAEQAQEEYERALQGVRALTAPVPDVLSSVPPAGVDVGPARVAWQAWVEAVSGPAEASDTAASAYEDARQAVDAVQEAAVADLRRRDDAWRPLATELAAWVATARRSAAAAGSLAEVKRAITWLRAAGQEIRDAQLAPFAAKSARVWEGLRQESNVELGPIRLEGSATQRRVALDVTVDGVGGAALGVMSQGELHALGLALFLPRATTEDSPFRFLVIDDPVQSMDPAKVDGLAQVLSEVAAARQVVVFSHDERLTESLRRLQLPATVWAVQRRESSLVELRPVTDPVEMYLDDARALARTDQLSEKARGVVVAGLCRSAIEAACHEAVRRRRIGRGVPHAEVERALSGVQKLYGTAALALFDDPARGGEVIAQIRDRYGSALGNAFVAAKDGPHKGYPGALPSFVQHVTRLTEKLRA